MNSQEVLCFLNNPENWYLSRNNKLVPSRKTAVSIDDYVIYQVDSIQQATSVNFESMRNILDAMQLPGILFFYVVEGKEGSLAYYYGISLNVTYNMGKQHGGALLEEASEIFKAVFAANYPQNTILELTDQEKKKLKETMMKYSYGAMIEGVPGLFNDSTSTLGADKVKQAMENDDFVLVELLRPVTLQENNYLTTSVLQVASSLEALANCTENNVVTGSKTCNFNVAASQLYSNSRIRSNNETRKEFRIVDDADTTPATPEEVAEEAEESTQVTPRQNLPTQTPTTSRVSEVLNGILDKGILGEDTSASASIHQPLEIQQLSEPQPVQNALQPRMQQNRIVTRPRQNMVPVRRQRRGRIGGRNLGPFANVLAAPNIPVGSALASQFVGSSLPLVDGEFLISDIERQVSKGFNNTRLFTSSDNISNSRSNTNSTSTTHIKRMADRKAISWIKYIDDLLYPRLDTGRATGLYMFGTGLFSNSQAILVKLASSLKYTYNSKAYNTIPMVMTYLEEKDVRWEGFAEFQLPSYHWVNQRCCFREGEIVARSVFSQSVSDRGANGGSFLSSKELSSIIALPL